MKITIKTGLFAKWDMYINSTHVQLSIINAKSYDLF